MFHFTDRRKASPLSYNRPLPQHLLHLWPTWSKEWRTRAQFHVLSVRKHDTSVSHVSDRWQRGIDWNLKGHGGWTHRHQKTPFQKAPPPKKQTVHCNIQSSTSSEIAVACLSTFTEIGCKAGSTKFEMHTPREFPGYWWLFWMQHLLRYSARLVEKRRKKMMYDSNFRPFQVCHFKIVTTHWLLPLPTADWGRLYKLL